METVLQDLRHGVRAFRQNLGFTVTAIVALAVGISPSTAIFSVLNAVLLRPVTSWRGAFCVLLPLRAQPGYPCGCTSPSQ